jgi:dipeptidase E
MSYDSRLKVLAIGGGAVDGYAKPLIKFGYEQFGVKPGANVLLIPTARCNAEGVDEWLEACERCFQDLGYATSILHRYKDYPAEDEIKELIDGADALYIAGGDSLYMMDEWNRLGISDELISRAKAGIPIGGVSAGAIAPMAFGHSDSLSFRTNSPDESWDYIKVKALGLLPFFITPHYNTKQPPDNKPRSKCFKKMVVDEISLCKDESQVQELEYYGLNNNTALVINNGTMQAIKSEDNQNIHRLFLRGGQIASEDLPIELV